MRKFRSTTILLAGILLGLVLGTAGVGTAAYNYQAWQALSDDFKNGYLVGFLAMSKLARNNADSSGWVDKHYPLVKDVRPIDYRTTLDKLYAKPENQKYNIDSMMQLVAHELGKSHPLLTGEQRQIEDLRKQLTELRRRQVEALKAKGEPIPPNLLEPLPQNPNMFVAAKPPAPKTVRPAQPKARKWCRCDGKDPKAARAERRAARDAVAKSATPGAANGAAPAVSGAAPAASGAAPAAGQKKPAEPRPAENTAPPGTNH